MKIFYCIYLLLSTMLITTQEYGYINLQTKGIESLDDKNWDNALYELKQVSRKYPQKGSPQLLIGELYQQRELYSISIPHLEKAKHLISTLQDTERISLYLCLSSAYHHTKKVAKEQDSLQILLRLTASMPQKQGFCQLALGLLHLQKNELQLAKEYLLLAEGAEYRLRKTHLALAITFSKLTLTEKNLLTKQHYVNLGRHYLFVYKQSFTQLDETASTQQEKSPELPVDTSDIESVLQNPYKGSLHTEITTNP